MNKNLYIISGCNGAGKTTASYTVLPEILECKEFVNADEIAVLVEFTKQQGGIEYAEQRMQYFSQLCKQYIDSQVKEKAVKDALTAYVDYVVQRNY